MPTSAPAGAVCPFDEEVETVPSPLDHRTPPRAERTFHVSNGFPGDLNRCPCSTRGVSAIKCLDHFRASRISLLLGKIGRDHDAKILFDVDQNLRQIQGIRTVVAEHRLFPSSRISPRPSR